jgi:hypothetical protein
MPSRRLAWSSPEITSSRRLFSHCRPPVY